MNDFVKKSERKNTILSRQVAKDKWNNFDEYYPITYEMVDVVTADHKTKVGWWNGFRWDGLRIKKRDCITQWRYVPIKEKE